MAPQVGPSLLLPASSLKPLAQQHGNVFLEPLAEVPPEVPFEFEWQELQHPLRMTD